MKFDLDRTLEHLKHSLGHHVDTITVKSQKTKEKIKRLPARGARVARNTILPIFPGVSKLGSRIPHLLTSNDPPQDEEVLRPKGAIGKVEKMKTRLFSLPSKVESCCWSLVTRPKTEKSNQQHRAVSPLLFIPPEVLQEIFLFVMETKTETRRQWTTVEEIPWFLGQVCKAWRIYALALPSLWTFLPTMNLSKTLKNLQLECLGELLHRSKSAPLDLHLYSLGFTGPSHPIIDLLIPHCERWEVVAIQTDVTLLEEFRSIKGRLLKLRGLTLYLSGYGNASTIDMFNDAPQLRRVDVGGPCLAEISLPFSQLEHYKDKLRMRNSMTRVVTASKTLETLTILELCETLHTPSIPAVTLPFLRKLHVKFCCTRLDFMNNLTLPGIEEIQMVANFDEGDLISTLIKIFLHSPEPCPLQVLRFRTHSIREGQLPDLLRITSQLKNLNMPLPCKSDIDIITEQRLAPYLETCEFFTDKPVHLWQAKAMNRLAGSRCESLRSEGSMDTSRPVRLRRLELHFDRDEWVSNLKLAFEEWEDGFCGYDQVSYLKSLKTELFRETLNPHRSKREGRIQEILNSIEEFEWHDSRELLVSEIHFGLKYLSEKGFAEDGNEWIAHRARKILEKWAPAFRDCRWMLRGNYVMVYVPHDDRIRRRHPQTLIYGVHDQMSYRTAFWPIYMN